MKSLALTLALLTACGQGTSPAPTSTASSDPAPTSAPAAASTSAPTASSSPASPSASLSSSASPSLPPVPEGMVSIPAGFSLMGDGSMDASPIHEIAVGAFLLDKMEVTMDAYSACVKADKCKKPKDDNPFCNVRFEGRGKHPVNCVDYRDAESFCAFVGKRLPTEREWEYAARGGAANNPYSWGTAEPTDKISCYMHAGGSCEVGSFPPGAFGLYDMTGNVWEWTSSWFAPYPDEARTGMFKVYRGGSWSRRFPKWMKTDLRNRYKVDEGERLGGDPLRQEHRAAPVRGGRGREGRCLRGGRGGRRCRPSSPSPEKAVPPPSSSASPSDTTDKDWAKKDPVKVRAPQFDDDCKAHYAGLPAGYNFQGGTFAAREPLVASFGCHKRDIGPGWTSVCCPG